MNPILYTSKETEFTSNGVGKLSECKSCIVTEELNGTYELEMEYPVTGSLYSQISTDMLILAKPNEYDDPQPFRIYDISRPMNGIITIKAEHISYMMNGIPVLPFEASGIGQVLTRLKENAAIDCPFTFVSTSLNNKSKFTLSTPQSMRACLGGVEGSILDVFGGEYHFDKFNVEIELHRGGDSGVTIEYGKNLTDFTQEDSIEDTYTGCIAFWQSSSTDEVKTVCGTVQYAENHASFGHERIYVYDASSDFGSDTEPTEAQLDERAAKYVKDNDFGTPKVNFKISFVQLWQTEEYKEIAPLERVAMGDKVHVLYPMLNASATAEVIETEYDTLLERYNSIELGNAKSSFSGTLKDSLGVDDSVESMLSQKQSFFQKAIDYATKLIQGGLGGHLVIGKNADGMPNELLIMDTDDKNTAVNVLRINMNGIGFSQTGYNGPFETAWTIDGHFNAKYIDTGVLNALLIRTGIIQDSEGLNFWNLDTGEMSLSSYYTKEETDGSISTTKSELTKSIDSLSSTVSTTYETRTDATTKLTTARSEIDALAKSISLGVTGELGGTASIKLTVDGATQSGSVDLSKIKKAWAADDTAVTVSAGTITFNSNSLAINSSYFHLFSDGSISATNGTFSGSISGSSISGGTISGSTIKAATIKDSNNKTMISTTGTGLILYGYRNYTGIGSNLLETSVKRDGAPCLKLNNSQDVGIPAVSSNSVSGNDGINHAFSFAVLSGPRIAIYVDGVKRVVLDADIDVSIGNGVKAL